MQNNCVKVWSTISVYNMAQETQVASLVYYTDITKQKTNT